MSVFKNELPQGGNGALRRAIYSGDIFILPATVPSQNLVAAVCQSLVQGLATEDVQKAQFHLSNDDMQAAVGKVRTEIVSNDRFHRLLLNVILELGFDLSQTAFDPLRMRAVVHDGHKIAAAAKAYSIHRDSWYANPQSQINWWIPLHDVTEDQTFGFYRSCFDRAIANESARFDWGVFAAQTGWQKRSTGNANIVYPTALAVEGFGDKQNFTCKKGDILIFSAAQLHQTNHNASGLTRFSVDFRTVDMGDEETGLGAPNTDNASTGSALVDYIRAASVAL